MNATVFNAQTTQVFQRFFLAEIYVDMGRRDDARRELNAVLNSTPGPGWAPETREFQQKARAMLDKLAK